MDVVKYYRFREYRYSQSQIKILLDVYDVIKTTPKGVWVGTFHSADHFVRNDARKKFAYPTITEAIESFVRRKEVQISILSAQIDQARQALALGKAEQRNAKSKNEGVFS